MIYVDTLRNGLRSAGLRDSRGWSSYFSQFEYLSNNLNDKHNIEYRELNQS